MGIEVNTYAREGGETVVRSTIQDALAHGAAAAAGRARAWRAIVRAAESGRIPLPLLVAACSRLEGR